MKRSHLRDRSFAFALKVVSVSLGLQNNKKEYIMSKQLLRSGTAIGALLSEAEFGQSKADYVHKFSISLKEANETKFWLDLLHKSEMISRTEFSELHSECIQLIKMLVSSINTLKSKNPPS